MVEQVIIKVRADGPFLVSGPAKLVDCDGEEFEVGERGDFVLCRCGQSGKRPFCDGAHQKSGFQAKETAATEQ